MPFLNRQELQIAGVSIDAIQRWESFSANILNRNQTPIDILADEYQKTATTKASELFPEINCGNGNIFNNYTVIPPKINGAAEQLRLSYLKLLNLQIRTLPEAAALDHELNARETKRQSAVHRLREVNSTKYTSNLAIGIPLFLTLGLILILLKGDFEDDEHRLKFLTVITSFCFSLTLKLRYDMNKDEGKDFLQAMRDVRASAALPPVHPHPAGMSQQPAPQHQQAAEVEEQVEAVPETTFLLPQQQV